MDNLASLSQNFLTSSYLLDKPYREFLIAVATGDGKIFNVFRRAKFSDEVGGAILSELERIGILHLEDSREKPIKRIGKLEIKKEFRRYRIQPKIRFTKPFYRFWFGFIEPYRKDLLFRKSSQKFWQNFKEHKNMAVSFLFEELSNLLLERIFLDSDPIVSKGGLWTKNGEFDLLCYTKSGKVILGECKFKGKKVCKSELTKLKEKSLELDFEIDKFALFSKAGFSKELKEIKDKDLMLFELKDFEILLKKDLEDEKTFC